jgi:hypothetical protein
MNHLFFSERTKKYVPIIKNSVVNTVMISKLNEGEYMTI